MAPCEYLLVRDPTVDTVKPYVPRLNELAEKFYIAIGDGPEWSLTERISRYAAVVILVDQGIVVGFGLLGISSDKSRTNLDAAFVDEKYQGRGLAGKIFDSLISESRVLGADEVVATVARDALGVVDKMLERRGFVLSNPNSTDLPYYRLLLK